MLCYGPASLYSPAAHCAYLDQLVQLLVLVSDLVDDLDLGLPIRDDLVLQLFFHYGVDLLLPLLPALLLPLHLLLVLDGQLDLPDILGLDSPVDLHDAGNELENARLGELSSPRDIVLHVVQDLVVDCP